jgi:hypothetical protein
MNLRAVAVSIALVVAIPPVCGQPTGDTSQAGPVVVGLPIVSSDGERVGQATSLEVNGTEELLIGEIDGVLGARSDTIATPIAIVARRAEHFQLSMTAAEIRELISGSARRGSAGRPCPPHPRFRFARCGPCQRLSLNLGNRETFATSRGRLVPACQIRPSQRHSGERLCNLYLEHHPVQPPVSDLAQL